MQVALNRLYDDFTTGIQRFLEGTGDEKLPRLIFHSMLVCGEDLGMIPDCVHKVMRSCRYSVGDSADAEGVEPHLPISDPCLPLVATTSTHDISPVRLWWGGPKTTQRFFNEAASGGDAGRLHRNCAGRLFSSTSTHLPCGDPACRTGCRSRRNSPGEIPPKSVSTCRPIHTTTGGTGCIFRWTTC